MTTAVDLIRGLRFQPVEPTQPDGPSVALTTVRQGRYLLDLLRREQRIMGPMPDPVYAGKIAGGRHEYEVRRMGRRFARNRNNDVCHVTRNFDTSSPQ